MRITPDSYRRSQAPEPRSSRLLTDLAEFRQARRSAAALRKSCEGVPWFVAARAGLDRRGHAVLRVFVRFTPSKPWPVLLPVRWDRVPVVLRNPSGEDIDMRDVVRPDLVAETSKAVCPRRTEEGGEPEASSDGLGQVLLFRARPSGPGRRES